MNKSWMPAFAGEGAEGSGGAKRRWKRPGGMTGFYCFGGNDAQRGEDGEVIGEAGGAEGEAG